MAKRYTRKQLRQPDEFVSFWTHAYEVLRGSGGAILVGLGLAVVVIAGLWAWLEHSARSDSEASRALSRAMRMYASDLVAEDAAPKPPVDEDLPRWKTAEERQKGTLAALDEVIAKHKRSQAAREAELVRAGVLFDAGRYDEALSAYGDFLARTDTENRLRFLAREGKGYAYEAKGQLDQALEEYRKLEAEADFYKDHALYQQARILEKKGDAKAAERLYKAILEKSPTTSLRDDISNRLAALEAR